MNSIGLQTSTHIERLNAVLADLEASDIDNAIHMLEPRLSEYLLALTHRRAGAPCDSISSLAAHFGVSRQVTQQQLARLHKKLLGLIQSHRINRLPVEELTTCDPLPNATLAATLIRIRELAGDVAADGLYRAHTAWRAANGLYPVWGSHKTQRL